MTKKELIYEIKKAEEQESNLREALGIHPMPIDQLITEDLLPA